MKHRHAPIFILGLLAMLLVGCAHPSTQPASEADTPHRKHTTQVIELPGRTLIFKPTRDDMTVGRVVFSVYCSKPDDVRINGVRPEPAWREVHLTNAGIVVDRRSSVVSAGDSAWFLINLSQVGPNRFKLAPLKFEVASDGAGGLVCMSVKVWFNEVSNQYDSPYYQNLEDRYALVSYGTRAPSDRSEAAAVRARFSQNHVATVNEFKEVLSKPFIIRLNQRPLREAGAR